MEPFGSGTALNVGGMSNFSCDPVPGLFSVVGDRRRLGTEGGVRRGRGPCSEKRQVWRNSQSFPLKGPREPGSKCKG